MKFAIAILVLLFFTSCFRFNGRITIQNATQLPLKIETNPVITSGSGGWENGIHFYNKDSIIWTYFLGNNIHARIIQPNTWKTRDSTFGLNKPSGYHYADYRQFRNDSTQNGIYEMYPNASFTIGEFNTHKKSTPSKDKLNGLFSIRKLIIYTNKDTLSATGDAAIWNLLLMHDKNKANFNKAGIRKKLRHWTVFIQE